MAGRLGVIFLLGCPSTVVGPTLEAALVRRGFFGDEDLGGGGLNDDSGVDAVETVKAPSDVANGLEGSWRKISIPYTSSPSFKR